VALGRKSWLFAGSDRTRVGRLCLGDRQSGTVHGCLKDRDNDWNIAREGRHTQHHIQCWARLGARSRPGEPSWVLSAGYHPTLATRPRTLRDVSPVRRYPTRESEHDHPSFYDRASCPAQWRPR
jgi:hypothetical protein